MAVVLHMDDGQPQGGMIGAPRGRNILAMAAAAEVVMQYWRYRPKDPNWSPLAALLFAGFVLLSATNTTGEIGLLFITPVFFLSAMFAVRGLARQKITGRWIGALAGVVAVSAVSTAYVASKRGELMDFGFSLLAGRLNSMEGMRSERPYLGPLFEQRGSAARVLKVSGYDGGHLRGTPFYDYVMGGWGPLVITRRYSAVGSNTLAVTAPKGEKLHEARVTRFARVPTIYAPLSSVSFDLQDAEAPDLAGAEDGPARAQERPPYVYLFTYRDGLAGETFQGVLASKLTPEMRTRCLNLPKEIRPVLTGLAETASEGAKEPGAIVRNVTAYLLNNHQYSLRWRPSGERLDPVVEFLTKKQSAHCEFFGSAAVLLLRAKGVPARYVTGFYAHEGIEDGVVVRQRDAHAWCEAWVDGVGWITVEATPPSGMPSGSEDQSVEAWRRFFEWLQDRWLALSDWIAERTAEQFTAAGTGLLLLLGGVATVRFLIYRRKTPRVIVKWRAPASFLPLASRFESVLKRHGVPVEPARPWSESIESLPEPLKPAAQEFVALYAAARFGGATDVSAMETALKALEAATDRNTDR
ncbi:MAG: transglutaminase-like domain-containing protein [Armatimonas sp.]